MINKKYLLVIDAILIFGSLLSIFFIVGYTQPLAIAPLDEERESLLFILPLTDYILIDDNVKFDSSETIFTGERIDLEKGRYFIKFYNGLTGEVRQLDLEIDVLLEFRKQDNKINVFAIGDSVEVETYDLGTLIGGEDE